MADSKKTQQNASTDAEEKFNLIVRVANTDLDGNKQLFMGLRKIKGVGESIANMVCQVTGFSKKKKVGTLTPEEVNAIVDVIKNPFNYGVPNWLVNHRNDIDTGEDLHLVGTDLRLKTEDNIKLMRKIKSYKGFRHTWRVPVRGQRTKSNFRRNKGKAVSTKKTTLKH